MDRLAVLPSVGLSVGLSMSVAAVCTAQPGRYRIERIPTIPGAGNGPDAAFAIDQVGRVVGFQSVRLDATTSRAHGYRWDGAEVVELPPLEPEFASSAAGANRDGLVVGFVQVADGVTAAAILTPTGPTIIGSLGGTSGGASGVNSGGLIVGQSRPAGSQHHAFWMPWPRGPMVDMGTLGGAWSSAVAVSDSGVIIGQSADSAGAARAFYAEPNVAMVDMNTLIPTQSGWDLKIPRDVNTSGLIVGEGTFNEAFASFVLRSAAGTLPEVVLPLPTMDRAHVMAINDAGVMAGHSTRIQGKVEGSFRATVWVGNASGRVARDLTASVVGYSGSTLEYAVAVNDAGQIVVSNPSAGLFARLTPVCPSDFDGDGFATGDDYDAFVDRFEAGSPEADFNGDGFVTADDFNSFVLAFAGGC